MENSTYKFFLSLFILLQLFGSGLTQLGTVEWKWGNEREGQRYDGIVTLRWQRTSTCHGKWHPFKWKPEANGPAPTMDPIDKLLQYVIVNPSGWTYGLRRNHSGGCWARGGFTFSVARKGVDTSDPDNLLTIEMMEFCTDKACPPDALLPGIRKITAPKGMTADFIAGTVQVKDL